MSLAAAKASQVCLEAGGVGVITVRKHLGAVRRIAFQEANCKPIFVHCGIISKLDSQRS